MIASVRGEVLVRRPDHVVIESGGLGYRLSVSGETLKAVPARGQEAALHAHLVVRDDSLTLYGFASESERDLFLHLTSISGVGPKLAVAILSSGAPRELLGAIASGDSKRFQAVPGVGKRTAERVIVELREKVVGELDSAPVPTIDQAAGDPRSQAREGLVGLGYTPLEAESLLAGASGETTEELIAAALRGAAAGGR